LRMRIIAIEFAIGKMIYSIRAPRHRAFAQPRPNSDMSGRFCCDARP
jgi:hypothetical protein